MITESTSKKLLKACRHALRVFDLYKNHPQMDTIREVLSKAIKLAESEDKNVKND